jgi:hypothetical protein
LAQAPPTRIAKPVLTNTKNYQGFAMELFSAAWWSALLAIVLIDLVLAGDNAIVIALAARNLPVQLRTLCGAPWVPLWCAPS